MSEIEAIYMNEREASKRYGVSMAWFQRSRWAGGKMCPSYVKLSGKVLYNIKQTDEFFSKLTKNNTSEPKEA